MPCCRHRQAEKKETKKETKKDCRDQCTCHVVSIVLALTVSPGERLTPHIFIRQTGNIELPEPALSSGFCSIWRPPKIS